MSARLDLHRGDSSIFEWPIQGRQGEGPPYSVDFVVSRAEKPGCDEQLPVDISPEERVYQLPRTTPVSVMICFRVATVSLFA